jgi:glycosyltransferase involved in cell wall biosynthesis
VSNDDLRELNDANRNSVGGTEITTKQIYDGTIPRELLEQFQIVPSRIRELDESRIRIYHGHDLPWDPEVARLKDPEFRAKFHKMVFSSEWQYSLYQTILGVEFSERCAVIEPGIVPGSGWPGIDGKSDLPVHLAYASTPQRGLEILVPVFERLAAEDPDVRLHVHSSFKLYGWGESDKRYEPLFDKVRAHPQMIYHGFTPHDKLMDSFQSYHVLAYPCTWLETSCRVLTEAMSAGLVAVHPNLGALPYTGGGLTHVYQGDSNPQIHAELHYKALKEAVGLWRTDREGLIDYLRDTKAYADARFNVDTVRADWQELLTSLAAKYPTVESRKFPAQMFRYSTG